MNKSLKTFPVTYLQMLFLSIILAFMMSACGDKYSENVLDLDDIEEIDLSPLTSDIEIIPIKCSVPMDGAKRMIGYEDYTFILGDAGETVYCIQGDTVIAVLNAVGRGHGEYTYIDDFTYEEKSKILYVRNDEKLLKYSVPSMSFLGSSDITYTTIGMIALNPDEILANCSFWEDDTYKECFNGLCIVSTATGEIIRRCFKFGYYDDSCLMFNELVKTEDGVLMPFCGVYKNKILLLDTTTGETKELDSFSFNENWRVPKSLIKCIKKGDSYEITQEAEKRTSFCDGCHYPIYVNSRLTYWCYPEENWHDTPILVIRDKDKFINRHFVISGTSLRINASFVKGDRFMKAFDCDPETIITDPDNASDLAKEIYRVMKAQPFNNPILLSYTVDKNI